MYDEHSLNEYYIRGINRKMKGEKLKYVSIIMMLVKREPCNSIQKRFFLIRNVLHDLLLRLPANTRKKHHSYKLQ